MENLQMLKMKDKKLTYDIDDSITRILCRIGMPAGIRGYAYVKTAITYAVEDNNRIYAITKQIYPEVAKQHNSTASRVERAIRHAIERTWSMGSVKRAVDLYGYSFRDLDFKPTNSEFIAEVVEIIMREYRLGNPIYY